MNRDAPAPSPIAASPVDWPTLLRQIRCPALLITGDPELGAMVTAKDAATLQEQVPGLRVAQIPDATHDVRRDQSDAFLEIIRPFLQDWASRRSA